MKLAYASASGPVLTACPANGQQVGATLFLESGGRREGDVLGAQLVVDVVLGEVGAPGEEPSGDHEDHDEDDADADEHGVDGATLERHRRLDRGGSGVGGGDDWVTGDGCHGVLLCVEVYVERTDLPAGAQEAKVPSPGAEGTSAIGNRTWTTPSS